jgi:hypothetical protein
MLATQLAGGQAGELRSRGSSHLYRRQPSLGHGVWDLTENVRPRGGQKSDALVNLGLRDGRKAGLDPVGRGLETGEIAPKRVEASGPEPQSPFSCKPRPMNDHVKSETLPVMDSMASRNSSSN